MTLSLGEFILALVAFFLATVAVQWVMENTLVNRRERLRARSVILCRICGVRYEAAEGQVCECPSCATPNEISPAETI